MKKAVMYGAGNIGRGFIGQLFSESGYEVAFIDINPVVLEKLNINHCYPINIVGEGKCREITVQNVRGVSGSDLDSVAYEIANTDIMATAVGVNILPRIAKPIALGLKKRWQNKNMLPLNIIICENLLDANHYLAKLIKQELSESECEMFDKTIGMVEASIGRMVPVMTPEMQGDNPLRIYVEEYCQLPVDKDAFKGEIPEIVNMIPFSPFDFYIQRKLFMHNMGHATTAYLGFLDNANFIWEALKNSTIKIIAMKALQEASVAMSQEHNVPIKVLLEHSDDLVYRFENELLGDTVERVGKDPVRKLSENDRLIGAAKLCMRQGIKPVYISLGIAAGYMFSPASDEYAARVQQVVKTEGIASALSRFSNIDDTNLIYNLVVDFYEMLNEGCDLQTILERAESVKAKAAA